MRHAMLSLVLACTSCAPVPAAAIEVQGDRIILTQAELHGLLAAYRAHLIKTGATCKRDDT